MMKWGEEYKEKIYQNI